MAKAPPPAVETIAPGRAAALIAWMLGGLVLALAAILALPNDPYYRFQQTSGTILFRARWVYERIHFDPTPIDVAVIGNSRLEATMRAGELSAALSRAAGHPVRVVNFGLPQEGRNLHWAITKELLANRPEVKLILLSVVEKPFAGHPAFRFLGDDASVATSPLFYNPFYALDLLTLPYRHVAYAAQSLAPRAFGLSERFDPAIHRRIGVDPTNDFMGGDGHFVNRHALLDQTTLAEQAAGVAATQDDPKLRFLPLDRRYAIERSFVRRIAALAAEKRVALAFLWVPMFRSDQRISDPGFYRAIGPVLEARQLGDDPADYMDVGHLNRTGSGRLVPWVADRLAPIYARAEAEHR